MDFYDLTRTDINTFGYSDVEVVKIRRIYDYFMGEVDEKDRELRRKDFYKFFSEHDKRRGTDFCKTYPELADFYHQCKEIK